MCGDVKGDFSKIERSEDRLLKVQMSHALSMHEICGFRIKA